MADLLGSILGSMEKPPSIPNSEKTKEKAQLKEIEKQQQKEKEKLINFRIKIQKDVEVFVKDSQRQKFKFKAMPKVYRAVMHDVAEVAGLVAFSFGEEDVDRHIILWKKEFAPLDDELAAYRCGEEWTEEKAKDLLEQRAHAEGNKGEMERNQISMTSPLPHTDYRDKYKHLIGEDAGKRAASSTITKRNYGFVSSENKRDLRTIEEVLAENKARKKQKTELKQDQASLPSDSTSEEGHTKATS